MKLRNLLTSARAILRPSSTFKKYFVYATALVAILGIIGMFISKQQNEELQKIAREATENRIARDEQFVELTEQLADMDDLTKLNVAFVADLVRVENEARLVLAKLNKKREEIEVEVLVLQKNLNNVHKDLARNELKDSFLAERIVEDLGQLYPGSGHLFFSETQENLFRTNPTTANLIYTVITENAVRIQIISNFSTHINILEEQLEESESIIELRNETIDKDMQWIADLQETQENLEAALKLDRRYSETLERQIALMRKKNFLERILPSLNVVVGPYYDPFKNSFGFGVALGFGWRF